MRGYYYYKRLRCGLQSSFNHWTVPGSCFLSEGFFEAGSDKFRAWSYRMHDTLGTILQGAGTPEQAQRFANSGTSDLCFQLSSVSGSITVITESSQPRRSASGSEST